MAEQILGGPISDVKAILDEIEDASFELPPDKRLIEAAYAAGYLPTAYVEPVAVGDVLSEMPIFPGLIGPAWPSPA
jgi:hypothetical protein